MIEIERELDDRDRKIGGERREKRETDRERE